MFKKVLVTAVGLALLASVGSAMADSLVLSGSVLTSADTGTPVYHRFFNKTAGKPVNPSGADGCLASSTIVGWDAATRSCQSKFVSGKGYRSYLEDVFNFTGLFGETDFVVFDMEQGTGANHAGYYFFSGKTITGSETWSSFASNCAGSASGACVGQGNTANAGGPIANTPLGSIAPNGGFKPIPVPTSSARPDASGNIPLQWVAASDTNGLGQVSYELYGLAKSSCSPPAASDFTQRIGNVTGTSTSVNVSAFGNTPATPACYYFALKLNFGTGDSGQPVISRYFSANSQGVSFGGSAATVTSIEAKLAGRSGIAVSWKTSLEDGVKGFYVTRSLTANGTYSRVSQLIAAKGQPSSYTYIDTTIPQLPTAGTGVFYKIETSDIDNNIQAYGPVQADLGNHPTTVGPKNHRR